MPIVVRVKLNVWFLGVLRGWVDETLCYVV